MLCWGLSVYLEEFLQISLMNELFNILYELRLFFDYMANIFITLAKSLQVSFSNIHHDSVWVLQKVICI